MKDDSNYKNAIDKNYNDRTKFNNANEYESNNLQTLNIGDQ